MAKARKRRGDRFDAALIRDSDPLHYFMGLLYPNRCDNEAYLSERIDITAINSYLEKKNAALDEGAYRYNLFQIIVTAFMKAVTLRPKMNRFYANGNYYQRNEVTAAFVVKKIFSDDGGESLAFLHTKGTDTLDTIHDEIFRQVSAVRSDKEDSSSNQMAIVSKLPRWVSRLIAHVVMYLERHGRAPRDMTATDPTYATVTFSNIGSLHLKSGYHHLFNYGTCSLFCLVGEIKDAPVFDADGKWQMTPVVDLGLTIDERIADGYYYSKTMRLLRHLLQHPELLERPLSESVDY